MAVQKEVCPFCDIIEGKIPSRRVYEDEYVLALLDISPASLGHMLLMPKQHVRTLTETPFALTVYLASLCKQLAWAALRGLHAQGTTIVLGQGEIAGQRAPHLLFHIIPRYEQDGLQLTVMPQQPFTQQDLNDIKVMLVRGIKEVIEESKTAGDTHASM